jgi:hypothetical protein
MMSLNLRWNDKESLCRVLLEWRASIPILNIRWVMRNRVPTIEREKPLESESFTRKTKIDIGKTYIITMRLPH